MARMARALSWLVLAWSVVVLIGWFLRFETLVRIVPDAVSFKANVAVAMALVAVLLLQALNAEPAGGLRSSRWARYVIGFILILGIGTVAQSILRTDYGIDELLVDDFTTLPDHHPGRMSELSALCLILMGIAFLLMDKPDTRYQLAARTLALAVFVVGYLAGIGYLFHAESFYHPGSMTALSIHGAAMLTLVPVAFFLARPDRGLARWLASDGTVGLLLRRLLPAVLFLAPLIAWLQGEAAARSGEAAAYVTLGNVALLVALVLWTTRAVQSLAAARELAETTLRSSQERLTWALQAAGGGAWDWDLDANRAWWSPEMYDLWLVEAGTPMQFANSVERVDPRDRESMNAALSKAIAEHTTYCCEFRILNPAGPERWMESRGRATYDASGHATRLLGITIDISAQKRVEISLRQANEALARSNAELQRFAIVASHDLQTPLRSIASFSELLMTRHAGVLPAQARQWLEHIANSSERLQVMVKSLLQYASVEVKAEPFEPVSMGQVLQQALDVLEISLKEAGARVEFDTLPVVMGDPTQLAEVWRNLIGNAVKYRGPDPPVIGISATTNDEGSWTFCVTDNGIGIEARHCERIFEIFERLHDSASYPGAGIGLAICRRVIERHGGRIWVESRPGHGSRFCFTLPMSSMSPDQFEVDRHA